MARATVSAVTGGQPTGDFDVVLALYSGSQETAKQEIKVAMSLNDGESRTIEFPVGDWIHLVYTRQLLVCRADVTDTGDPNAGKVVERFEGNNIGSAPADLGGRDFPKLRVGLWQVPQFGQVYLLGETGTAAASTLASNAMPNGIHAMPMLVSAHDEEGIRAIWVDEYTEIRNGPYTTRAGPYVYKAYDASNKRHESVEFWASFSLGAVDKRHMVIWAEDFLGHMSPPITISLGIPPEPDIVIEDDDDWWDWLPWPF